MENRTYTTINTSTYQQTCFVYLTKAARKLTLLRGPTSGWFSFSHRLFLSHCHRKSQRKRAVAAHGISQATRGPNKDD